MARRQGGAQPPARAGGPAPAARARHSDSARRVAGRRLYSSPLVHCAGAHGFSALADSESAGCHRSLPGSSRRRSRSPLAHSSVAGSPSTRARLGQSAARPRRSRCPQELDLTHGTIDGLALLARQVQVGEPRPAPASSGSARQSEPRHPRRSRPHRNPDAHPTRPLSRYPPSTRLNRAGEAVGKRHRRIRARSATGQVAGAATEKPGLKQHPSPKNRPAQHAFSRKPLSRSPDPNPAGPEQQAPSDILMPRRAVTCSGGSSDGVAAGDVATRARGASRGCGACHGSFSSAGSMGALRR